MAAQGPKSGGCGEGLEGVLLCRAVGLERLHHWTLEPGRKPTHSGTAWAPRWHRAGRGHERLAREKPRVAIDRELPAAGADATLAAFDLEAAESRSRLLGLGSPRSALPFRQRAAPCLLQPRHCAPGSPGVRPARPPSGRRDSSSWTDPRPPAPGQTSFLPGPCAKQADRRLPRRSPLGSGRASLLSAPLQPRAPGAYSRPRAAAPTKPEDRRRPGEGLGVAAGTPEPEGGVPSAGRVQWEGAAGT
ncbi:uncharacterized protein LOC124906984 [Homo sapiens]|uniref:uncharacterized protein LOC124906984 n=1 Tax=Homo sapiens TaxID=9606 RepID=UPI0005D01A5F|nr:uncharacterized protein LOC124906984 [Homo sapiens]|eukprot:XP_011537364.1 uncharacterized protein LOC105369869 [Homo sapiens]